MLSISKKFLNNIYDSIRFMPKIYRRRLYLTATITATLTTTGIYVNMQTFNIDSYVDKLQMYKMKIPMPVNDQLYDILNEIIENNDIGFKLIDRKKITNVQLFNTFGCDLYSIGNLNLSTGAYIGVPYTFNFDSIKQLNTDEIRLLGRYRTKRTRNSPVIKNLFNSLILSNDAKRYALTHELTLLSSSYFLIKSINIMLMTFTFMFITPKFLNKFIDNKKLLYQIMGIILCLFIFTFITILLDHLLDYLYDLYSLKLTIQKNIHNDKYIDGIREFYQKLIKRNQSLYELLGEYGTKFYTVDGKTKHLFGLYRTSYETHLNIIDYYYYKYHNNEK